MPNNRHTKIPHDSQLWTRQDIARFLQRSPSHVYRKTNESGFPAPAGCDQDRWWSSDIREFAAAPDPHALTNGFLHHRNSTGRVTRKVAS
jgi:predicted DNA-binding transcriptional regulator AlpA